MGALLKFLFIPVMILKIIVCQMFFAKQNRRTVRQFPGHQGAVRGLTVSTDGRILVSCGTDCTLRLWKVPGDTLMESDDGSGNSSQPLAVYVWKNAFCDRSINIYDLRMSTPARKVIMRANDDGKCYSYDVRKLNEAKCVHKDHVSSVMDIDYLPTGREFVTGPYDRTVRIFQYNGGHSREIYHTKRMQRVFCVKFSCDASYIISGSDDTNLRLWKAKASEQLGVTQALANTNIQGHKANTGDD
ncbi:PREDICTED: DDB1- and CUL4-associated factor 13-like [Nicotiana attenuata]|uniref:DDB1- and CUL4-associated factor 13-like n=1 Tax=Nicotiana attenuata TaxID=49451 RepID=UPI000904A6F9|nr:PREDICTED: DDB1- and CUL4-associated factor 13-like [Nicotiana attenuata]